MKIGVSTKIFRGSEWIKKIKNIPFDTIEINRNGSRMSFLTDFLDVVKDITKDINLSMHSETSYVFVENLIFTKAHLEMLKAEIEQASYVKAKEIIFHLPYRKMTKNEENKLQKIFDFAYSKKVDMVFESNSKLDSKLTLHILKRFPKLKYNLDMGHLNLGYHKIKQIPMNDFLNAIKDRTVYIHMHGNDGTSDQHKPMIDGILDWKNVLNKLKLNKIKKIIFEVHELKDAIISKRALDNYLKNIKKK